MAAQRSKLKPTSSSTSHPSSQNTSLTPSTQPDLTSEYQSSSPSPSSRSEPGSSNVYKTRYFPSQLGEDWVLVEKQEGEDGWDLLSEMNRAVKVPSTEREEEEEEEVEMEVEMRSRCMWKRMKMRDVRNPRGMGRGSGRQRAVKDGEAERRHGGNGVMAEDDDEGDWERDFCKVVGLRGDGEEGEFDGCGREKGRGKGGQGVKYGVSVVEGGAGGVYAWQEERGEGEKVGNFCLGCRMEVCTCPEAETEAGCGKCL